MLDRLRSQLGRLTTRARPTEGFLGTFFGGGGPATTAGPRVTPATAQSLAAVSACVAVIAESVASVPCNLLRLQENGGRERAADLPLFRVLRERPTEGMDAFGFFEMMTAWCALRGNAYAEIVRDGAGRVTGLIPIRPDWVTVLQLESGALAFDVRDFRGRTRRLLRHEVLHLRYRSDDGLVGLSPIQIAAETLGSALAVNDFAGRLFSQGTRLSGAILVKGKLTPEVAARMQQSWNNSLTGPGGMHRVPVLEEDTKFEPFSMSAADSQLIEARRFSVEEVARIFRVPLCLIGVMEKHNYASAVESTRAFTRNTLGPWIRRWESALAQALLTDDARRSLTIEFDLSAMVRGDGKELFEVLEIGRRMGVYSVNEAREMLNMSRVPDGDGRIQPVNYAPLGWVPAEPFPGATNALGSGGEPLDS